MPERGYVETVTVLGADISLLRNGTFIKARVVDQIFGKVVRDWETIMKSYF